MISHTLQDLLDEAGIRHFSIEGDHRLLSPAFRGGRGIHVPDEALWPNIIPTLELADEIRERLGAPVRVVSGYRTPTYNELVGSAPTSEHVQFRALDLTWSGPMSELWMVTSEAMDHAHARGIRTGRGLYDTFVHIDTGSTKGALRRWDSRSK